MKNDEINLEDIFLQLTETGEQTENEEAEISEGQEKEEEACDVSDL